MIKKTVFCLICAVSCSLLVTLGCLHAGEHPTEHPSEHPAERPVTKKKPALTKEELAEAIAVYVQEEAAQPGGYYQVFDEVAGKTLKLKLKKVHKERLAGIGNNIYFACADFQTPTGKLYDLDFFMEGTDKDQLKFVEVTVHKEDGEARYTWYEEGGIWKKKSIGGVKKSAEHPHEHPQGAEHPK